ncbi:MAG TPA: ABC transporter permease subunit [Solirubrobacterales bacterium]|nr:ABC transporter permease subunit [Solirubrobacterales bacterium]
MSRSGAVAAVDGAATIVRYALREAVRRRIFAVVVVLTVLFLALYGVGAHFAFRDARHFAGPQRVLDPTAFTGATIFGLAMFATLFLGAVLAVFLTLGVARGDSESGLLQPLVVRPLGRGTLLGARFAGAALFSSAYVLAVYLAALLITGLTGDWWPDHVVGPGLALAVGVVVVAAISLACSVVLSATAQGIAVMMVYGAGLTAGLLGQIGHALDSHALKTIAQAATWALPFEALYQAGLHALVSNTTGLTGAVLQLGPFGGSQAGSASLVVWSIAYVTGLLAIAMATFGRRDL